MSSSIQIQQDNPARQNNPPSSTPTSGTLPSAFSPRVSPASTPVPMNYCYFCIVCTSQSNPSSSPSPLVAQLPRTDHSLPFSPPARPSLSEISAGERAPSTSCSVYTTVFISKRSFPKRMTWQVVGWWAAHLLVGEHEHGHVLQLVLAEHGQQFRPRRRQA